jgi:hypothetical protein
MEYNFNNNRYLFYEPILTPKQQYTLNLERQILLLNVQIIQTANQRYQLIVTRLLQRKKRRLLEELSRLTENVSYLDLFNQILDGERTKISSWTLLREIQKIIKFNPS